jgi:hypothetical protein
MPMTEISHRLNARTLWPWVVGAFLVGAMVMVFMPPLLPIGIVALSVWVFARRGRQTSSSRKVLTVDVGLLLATALYLIVWIAGNISR